MNAVAFELDQRLQSLDPETAAKCEQIVRNLLALLTPKEPLPKSTAYRLPTFNAEYQPGIDRTKLNHLAWED